MKNVLVIVHLLRATPRVEGLVRHLHEFDWLPIVLTGATSRRLDSPVRIVETPYRDSLGLLGRLLKINPEKDPGQQLKGQLGVTAKKSPLDFLFTLGGAIINYPCPDKNWKPFALEATRKLIKEEKMDAIISSSAPLTSHLIASQLKAEYDIPWIADLRDPWSQNHNYSYGPVRKLMDRRLELKTLARADALITVSEPWAENLRALHKGKTVYFISHGYNPSEVNVPPVKLTDKFTITYTGSFYVKWQHPSKLFAALKDLIADGTINKDDVEVRFFGAPEGWLAGEIEQHGLSDIVRQYGQVTKAVSMAKQKESQVLLHLDWDDPREKGVYSGKLYEYLGARRPILSTGGSRGDVVEELLSETAAGVTAMTIEEIKNSLTEFYREYKVKKQIAFHGEEAKIQKYTHREMAGKFAEILNRLVK